MSKSLPFLENTGKPRGLLQGPVGCNRRGLFASLGTTRAPARGFPAEFPAFDRFHQRARASVTGCYTGPCVMSGRLDSNQRPPEPHLRRQVANPWHSSPYTFNNTQETQDFNGFAKGLLRSVMRPGWSGRHSLPALLSGSRLPRLASQRSLPTPDTPAIASTSNAGARLHRLGIRRRANHGQSSLDVRIRRRDSRRLAAGSSGIEILEFP